MYAFVQEAARTVQEARQEAARTVQAQAASYKMGQHSEQGCYTWIPHRLGLYSTV